MTQNKKKTQSGVSQFKFYQVSQIHFLNTRQICMYIKNLHQIIRKQQFYLEKFKKRIRKGGSSKKVQKEVSDDAVPKVDEDEERDKKVSNFLDEIKSAATEGWIQQMGMVYEPTSGMYYHPTTGYYYNAEYNLYYDGNTGTYLTYNEQTFAYEFYSKVETVETKTSQGQERSSDKAKPERKRKRTRASDGESLDEFGRSRTRRADTERSRRRGSRSGSSVERRRRMRHRSRDKYRGRSSSNSDSDRRRSRQKTRSRNRSKQRSKVSKHKRSPEKRRKRSRSPSSVEEGELSAGTTSGDISDERNVGKKVVPEDGETVVEFRHPRKDIAAKYPPSLRLIIQETDLQEKLKVGSLFIIPFTGGSLGREGAHDIIIPDVNISKTHLRFTYNSDKDRYECADTGSRNGTLLNGKRMSETGIKSKRMTLTHDSVIELNKTKILCHIHEGHTTCDKCEPGIIQKSREVTTAVNASMEVLSHKAALKQLQKRYGLENEKYIEDPKDKATSSSYKDRADTRRKTVGSSHHTEKTVTASVDTSISSDNKGFKMLSKLGWTEGQTLGKSDTGLLEPIPIVSNEGTKGLGCDEPRIGPILNKRRAAILAKTQQRFAESGSSTENKATKLLNESDDSD